MKFFRQKKIWSVNPQENIHKNFTHTQHSNNHVIWLAIFSASKLHGLWYNDVPVQVELVVVIVAAVVVEAAVLTVGCPAAAAGIAARPSSAWPATGRYSAPGWDASVAPSDAGCPSAAVDGVVPSVVYSAATGSPDWCCRQGLPAAMSEAQQ